MTTRSRFLPWLVAAVLAMVADRSSAQDAPLYRDPSPTEGARIEGPLLPARPSRPSPIPPLPSGLGPFQGSSSASGVAPPASEGLEPIREPLLSIAPIPPPLPAMPMPPIQTGGDVQIKRTTKIRAPHGVFGRCHDWFHDAFFGPQRPSTVSTISTTPKHRFFGIFHQGDSEAEAPSHVFNWPSWPTWPLSSGH